MDFFRKLLKGSRKQGGYTLVELLVVVAIIGLLSAASVVLYNGARVKASYARVATDVLAVADAVSAFQAETGTVLTDVTVLTQKTTLNGQDFGPYLAIYPPQVNGWSPIGFTPAGAVPGIAGSFSIFSTCTVCPSGITESKVMR